MIVKLKNIISEIRDGTHGSHERVNSGIPFLSAKNVHNNGLKISESESMVSENEANIITSNGFPIKDDVLFTCVGTIGRCSVYELEYSLPFQRSVAFLRPQKTLVSPKYLKYSMEADGFQEKLMLEVKQTAQAGVYMGDIREQKIKLPSLLKQNEIVTFLDGKISNADSAINTLKQKLIHLDEYKTALIHNAVTKGLDAKGNSILDGTPVWRKSKLKSVASYQKGSKPKNLLEVSAENTLPYISMQQLRGNIEAKEYAKIGDGILVNDNDLIILWDGANAGELIRGKLGILSSTMAVFRSSNVDLDYLYYSLVANEHELRNKYIGMGIPHVSSEILNSILISHPDNIKDQLVISNFINRDNIKIDAAKKAINKKIALLVEYKKSLINEAVSGEIKL